MKISSMYLTYTVCVFESLNILFQDESHKQLVNKGPKGIFSIELFSETNVSYNVKSVNGQAIATNTSTHLCVCLCMRVCITSSLKLF